MEHLVLVLYLHHKLTSAFILATSVQMSQKPFLPANSLSNFSTRLEHLLRHVLSTYL